MYPSIYYCRISYSLYLDHRLHYASTLPLLFLLLDPLEWISLVKILLIHDRVLGTDGELDRISSIVHSRHTRDGPGPRRTRHHHVAASKILTLVYAFAPAIIAL